MNTGGSGQKAMACGCSKLIVRKFGELLMKIVQFASEMIDRILDGESLAEAYTNSHKFISDDQILRLIHQFVHNGAADSTVLSKTLLQRARSQDPVLLSASELSEIIAWLSEISDILEEVRFQPTLEQRDDFIKIEDNINELLARLSDEMSLSAAGITFPYERWSAGLDALGL